MLNMMYNITLLLAREFIKPKKDLIKNNEQQKEDKKTNLDCRYQIGSFHDLKI